MVSASTFSGLTISSVVVGIFVQAGHPTLWGKKIVGEGPIRHGDGISLRLVEGMGWELIDPFKPGRSRELNPMVGMVAIVSVCDVGRGVFT